MRDLDKLRDKTVLALDSRQLFFVFFGGSVAAALLFALGIIVGRKLPPQEASVEEDPLAMLDQLGAEEETLSFQKGLKGRAQAPVAAPSPAPEPAPSPMPAARAPEPAAQAPPAVPSAPGSEEHRPVQREPEPAASPAAPGPDRPAPERARRERPKAPEPQRDSAVPTTEAGRFTLQLSSFQEKGEAEEFMQALGKKGYQTYLVSAEVPGRGLWYRVRLGDYGAHADALAAKSEFERKQRIIAYVLRK